MSTTSTKKGQEVNPIKKIVPELLPVVDKKSTENDVKPVLLNQKRTSASAFKDNAEIK